MLTQLLIACRCPYRGGSQYEG